MNMLAKRFKMQEQVNDAVGKVVTVSTEGYTMQVKGVLEVYRGGNYPLYSLKVHAGEDTVAAAQFFMTDVVDVVANEAGVVIRLF